MTYSHNPEDFKSASDDYSDALTRLRELVCTATRLDPAKDPDAARALADKAAQLVMVLVNNAAYLTGNAERPGI